MHVTGKCEKDSEFLRMELNCLDQEMRFKTRKIE